VDVGRPGDSGDDGGSSDGKDTSDARVTIVDTRNLADDTTGETDQDVEITGSGSIVVRGSGSFRGTEELASGGAPDVDNVLGDNSAQTLFFGPGDDTIRGRGGDDRVASAGGEDRLFGGSGNDTVSGGAGDDTLFGGAGTDSLIGGAGRDTFAGTLSELDGDTIADLAVAADPAASEAIRVTGRTDIAAGDVTLGDGALSGAPTALTIDPAGPDTAELAVTLDTDADPIRTVTLEVTQDGGDTLIRPVVTAPDDAGGASDQDLANALFLAIQGRANLEQGEAFWTGQIGAHGLTTAATWMLEAAVRSDAPNPNRLQPREAGLDQLSANLLGDPAALDGLADGALAQQIASGDLGEVAKGIEGIIDGLFAAGNAALETRIAAMDAFQDAFAADGDASWDPDSDLADEREAARNALDGVDADTDIDALQSQIALDIDGLT
jgi:hypothetical protein